MTRGLVGGVVLGVLYVVISQLVGFAHLLLAAALEWQVPGYHEPADYAWWSWLLCVVWVAGFIIAVWWGAARFRTRPEPVTTGTP